MTRPQLPGTNRAYIATLSLVFMVLGSLPFSANAQIDRLDHFRCYQAKDALGNGIDNPLVLLRDQFDVLDQQVDLAFVILPYLLCNPVEKTTESGEVTPRLHLANHLTFYLMLDVPPGPQRDVLISNQFGEQRMRVDGRSLFLAVPTEKNNEGPWQDLDHFKCNLVQGEPLNALVRLRDQFFETDPPVVQVMQPQLLCKPTVKLHAGNLVPIENDEAHLVCYATTRTPYQDLVTTRNQFAATELGIGDGVSLCVPSKKQVASGPQPDLTIELPNPARVSCPGGPNTCTQEMDYVVRELNGVAVAAPFTARITNELGQTQSVVIPGIAGGGASAGTLLLGPAAGNCYNPDCTTTGEVDVPLPNGVIPESNESNNTAVRTDLG